MASQPGFSAAPSTARADVVFTFSYMTWNGAARREWFMPEDRLAQSLLAEERIERLLVADTLCRAPMKFVRDLTAHGKDRFPAGADTRLVQPVRLWNARPTSLRGVVRAIAGYDRSLRRAAERMGLEDPVLVTAHPLVAGFADLSWARGVTFYAVDDWTLSPAYRRWWPVYRAAYDRIRARGIRVGAVSKDLRERLASTGPSVLVPNGLDPAEWVGAPTPPWWAAAPGRPILVYAGTLDARLDGEAVARIAHALPNARVVLVGRIADGRPLQALRELPNIEVRPALGRAEYAGLLRSADVGLIPHVRSKLTATIEPQKVYEYLAGGLPVVATDLEPIRGIDQRVQLVPESGDFAQAVHGGLQRGHATEDERLAFVHANSWRARHQALIELALA